MIYKIISYSKFFHQQKNSVTLLGENKKIPLSGEWIKTIKEVVKL
jgi:hypothetical protein